MWKVTTVGIPRPLGSVQRHGGQESCHTLDMDEVVAAFLTCRTRAGET